MFEVASVRVVVMPVFRHDIIYFNQMGGEEIKLADSMLR